MIDRDLFELDRPLGRVEILGGAEWYARSLATALARVAALTKAAESEKPVRVKGLDVLETASGPLKILTSERCYVFRTETPRVVTVPEEAEGVVLTLSIPDLLHTDWRRRLERARELGAGSVVVMLSGVGPETDEKVVEAAQAEIRKALDDLGLEDARLAVVRGELLRALESGARDVEDPDYASVVELMRSVVETVPARKPASKSPILESVLGRGSTRYDAVILKDLLKMTAPGLDDLCYLRVGGRDVTTRILTPTEIEAGSRVLFHLDEPLQIEAGSSVEIVREGRTVGTAVVTAESQPEAERRVRIGFAEREPSPPLTDDEILPPERPLAAGSVCYLRLDISAEEGGTNVVEPVAIPRAVLERIPEGAPLEVAVFSDDFAVDTRGEYRGVQPLRLLPGAASTFVHVRLRVPEEPGVVRLWVCVFFRNTLLQWLETRARVVAPGTPKGRTPEEEPAQAPDLGNESRVVYTISPTFRGFETFDSPAASILFDGVENRIVVRGRGGGSASVSVLPTIETSLGKFRRTLGEINEPRPGHYPFLPGNRGKPRDLAVHLVALAKLGRELFHRAFDSADIEAILKRELEEPGLIEISRRTAGKALPWSAFYDLPLMPEWEAKMRKAEHRACMLWAEEAHQKEEGEGEERRRVLDFATCVGAANCPRRRHEGESDEAYRQRLGLQVCVYGFWGFKHRLQQPPGAWEADEKEKAEHRAAPSGAASPAAAPPPPVPHFVPYAGRPTLGVIANQTISFYPEHRSELRDFEAGGGGPAVKPADDLDSILERLRDPGMQIVYFYCHGGKQDNVPVILVGENDIPISQYVLAEWEVDWPGTPLVFVNGCETVAYSPEDLTTMALQFRNRKAAGVIGTETKVFPVLARWFGREFLRRFLAGEPVGEILLALRLELLAQYNPLGLIYTNHTLAGLRLADEKTVRLHELLAQARLGEEAPRTHTEETP